MYRNMKTLEHENKIKKESGFTIIETLISLTIFSMALTGLITVAAKGSFNINAARDRLTATYLADEGIELMRAMRDTSVLESGSPSALTAGWLRFVSTAVATCSSTAPCDIGYYPFPQFSNFYAGCAFTPPASTGKYCPLYYDTVTGFYNNQGYGTRTAYSRSLVTEWSPSDPSEVKVTSTVIWREGSVYKNIVQTESIFNWYSS
jgi:prepilin-type N-terminal cleavage/methylation domain-containing protein